MNRTTAVALLKLVVRQAKKNIVVQIAVAILFASAITILALYSAFINREAELVAAKMPKMVPEGHILVRSSVPEPLTKGIASNGVFYIGAWDEVILPSNVGTLPTVLLSDAALVPALSEPGHAAAHTSVAARFGLTEGDHVTLYENGKAIKVQIALIYNDASISQGFYFGERLLVNTGTKIDRKVFYFEDRGPWGPEWALGFLQRSFANAQFLTSRSELIDAGRIVGDNYNQALQSKLLFIIFISIAFLSAKLLMFLDHRKILAILKAIGLRNSQVFVQVSLEALFSPACGALVGWASTKLVLDLLEGRGLGLSFTPGLVIQALGALIPAIVVGVSVPARLAQVGSVMELSLERSLTLFQQSISRLEGRLPALDLLVDQGVKFVKVDVVDGAVDGFIFRKHGDRVRMGEVMATTRSWAGLKKKDILAPVTGTIVFYQPETGFIGVLPDDTSNTASVSGETRLSLATGGQDN